MGHKVSGMGRGEGIVWGEGTKMEAFPLNLDHPPPPPHKGALSITVVLIRGLTFMYPQTEGSRFVVSQGGWGIYANKFRPPVKCYQDFLFLSQTIVAVNGQLLLLLLLLRGRPCVMQAVW